jgi:5'-nucleotidase
VNVKEQAHVQILLTNDDGVYAPGLAALETEMRKLGDVTIVAPATEQSGVGHAITFLTPLICHAIYDRQRQRGWSVEGSPADCVKLGVFELCPRRPNLVVSGINGGLNAGINVLYSGTVAAAIEGAFFGITSFAVSLEYDEHANFEAAARIAGKVIQQVLENKNDQPELFNINIPTTATTRPSEVHVVPMGLERFGDQFLKRTDPKGRTYYWATGEPAPPHMDTESDLTALQSGHVTISPLRYDLTRHDRLAELRRWKLGIRS